MAGRTLFIFPEFMTALRSFPVRRFHLTVGEFGVYHDGFTPELVGNIFSYLPDIEELVLDHYCNTKFAPLPGTLVCRLKAITDIY